MNPKAQATEAGSPEWLVHYLERARLAVHARAIARVSPGKLRVIAILLSVISGISLLLFHGDLVIFLSDGSQFNFHALSYVIPILIPPLLFPIAPLLRDPAARAVGRMGLFLASLSLLLGLSPHSQTLPLAVSVAIGFLVPLIGFCLARFLPAGSRAIFLLGVAVASSMLLAFARARLPGDWRFLFYVLFSLPALPLGWLAEEGGSNGGLLSFLAYYFSPLNLAYFVPVRAGELHFQPGEEATKLFLSGWENVVFGLACVGIGARFGLGHVLHAHGAGAYLFVFFDTWGFLRIATGLGRMLGYPLPAPFFYPLLAADPGIHWRRWNTYFYRWFRAFVFFPVVRRTGSVLLAMVLIFCVNFYLHVAEYLFLPLFIPARSELLESFLSSRFYFFAAQAALIYVYFITSRFWPSGKARKGWVGVAVTNALLGAIHLLS